MVAIAPTLSGPVQKVISLVGEDGDYSDGGAWSKKRISRITELVTNEPDPQT